MNDDFPCCGPKAPSIVVLDAMDTLDNLTEAFVHARANGVVGTALLPYVDRVYGAAQRLISLTQS